MTAPSAFGSLPGTAPARRQYPPSPPPFDPATVGGRDPIEHAARVQRAAAEQYQQWRNAFGPNVSGEDRRGSAGWFQTSEAAHALQPALEAARAHADEADQAAKAGVDSLAVPDDKHDAARRIWDRSRYQLDAADGVPAKVAVAQRLVANAQRLELATLKEELPAYFSAVKQAGGKAVPMDWLTDALASQVTGNDDARAEAALRAKRVAVLNVNHNNLTRAFAAGTPASPLLDPYAPSITADVYDNGTVR